MAPVIEILTERATLGEGPHWDEPTQSLYFVDIFGQTINKFVPATGLHTKAKIGKFVLTFCKCSQLDGCSDGGMVTLVIPVDGADDTFLVSIGTKLFTVKWDGQSDKVTDVKQILEVENEPKLLGNRFNDGKADPTGRLWAGKHICHLYLSCDNNFL